MDKRQIDRLIAEKVYGWETQEFKNIDTVVTYTEDGEELKIPEDFNPTGGIESAWNVLKEIKKTKGIQADLSTNDFSIKLYIWKEDKTPPYNYKQTLAHMGDEETPINEIPITICRAVIEALDKINS